MNRVKLVLITAISIATAFTISSCGGSKPSAAPTGFNDVINQSDEFTKMCRTELKEHLCGVGENTSTNSQIARDIATANARNELAAKIQVSIESALKRATNNTLGEQGRETTISRLAQEVSGDFSNIEIYETKTQFNEAENKYRIYALVVVKKDAIKDAAKNKVSNAQVLSDAAATKVFMDMIDEEIDKRK
jgi:HEPN domain-containing protein